VYAFLCNADDMREVYARTSLHCERLKNDPNKKMSIKLNDAWRLEFVLRSEGTKQIIKLIRISNHYE
jgi:plasmid maintenance system killer protein